MKKKMLTNILEDTDPIFFRVGRKEQLFTINNDCSNPNHSFIYTVRPIKYYPFIPI